MDGNKQIIDKIKIDQDTRMFNPNTMTSDKSGHVSAVEQRSRVCKKDTWIVNVGDWFPDEEVIIDLNTSAITPEVVEHGRTALELINNIKLISIIYPKKIWY